MNPKEIGNLLNHQQKRKVKVSPEETDEKFHHQYRHTHQTGELFVVVNL